MINVTRKDPRRLVALEQKGRGYVIFPTSEGGYVTLSSCGVVVCTGTTSLDVLLHHDGITPIYEEDKITITFR